MEEVCVSKYREAQITGKVGSIQGVKAEFTQLQGEPGRVICQLAKNWGADLIAMGRRGHSGIEEMVLGSVSNYVLHRSHCSVQIVQS